MRIGFRRSAAIRDACPRNRTSSVSVPFASRSRVSFRATRWRLVRYEPGVSKSEPDLIKKKNNKNEYLHVTRNVRRLGQRNSRMNSPRPRLQITTRAARVTRSCPLNSSSRPQTSTDFTHQVSARCDEQGCRFQCLTPPRYWGYLTYE